MVVNMLHFCSEESFFIKPTSAFSDGEYKYGKQLILLADSDHFTLESQQYRCKMVMEDPNFCFFRLCLSVN